MADIVRAEVGSVDRLLVTPERQRTSTVFGRREHPTKRGPGSAIAHKAEAVFIEVRREGHIAPTGDSAVLGTRNEREAA